MGLISAALQLVSSTSKARSFPRSSKWTWLMNLLRFQRPFLSFCAEPHWCREPAAVWAGKNPLWRTFLGWSCYCWVSTRVRHARFILAVWGLECCFLANPKEAALWGNKRAFFWLQFLCGWGRLSLKRLIMVVICESFEQRKFLSHVHIVPVKAIVLSDELYLFCCGSTQNVLNIVDWKMLFLLFLP